MSKQDTRIEAYSSQSGKYVSFPEHTKYKYLIDVQGRGWSARTKLLLFSGRPLFLVDREWKDYWYQWITPYVHYIPVNEDLSNLSEQINWAENHPDECKNIANNAMIFAKEHLTRDRAVAYLGDVLLQTQKCRKV